MRISDWSSDVCSSDLSAALITTETTGDPERDLVAFLTSVAANVTSPIGQALVIATLNDSPDPRVREQRTAFWRDRKRVVTGKSVSVRVASGGRRIIKQKKYAHQLNRIRPV